ncbi:MAG: apolipoprotein N-acyltransferase [Minwuia sp.]|uniref:apolipoprotein N-acyltransferase n=1 Tax=Minwuia sp. TaxID=2493630 RepID=UPI003A8AE910
MRWRKRREPAGVTSNPAGARPRNRLALAFLLGAITTLVFAPFHILPLGFLGFAGLLWLLSKCGRTPEAFWTGWFFGWGHFIAGLYWIASAFLVEPEKFAWMIPFPTLGLPALLALFTSAATALAWRVAPTGWRRLLALAAAWTLAEMARGWVLTGFPWNLAGYALGAHHLLMQPAAWAGVFGLSFLAVLGFAAPALLAGQNRSPRAAGAALAFVAVILAAGALRPEPAVHAPGAEPVSIRIVQGNIPQREKWRPDRVEPNFRMLLEMSRGFDGDLVIWPETAATFLLSRAPGPLAAIAGVAPPGGHVVTGAPRVEDIGGNERFYNSAILIGSDGRIADSADKHHLVPFGEYLPMRAVLQRIGLDKLAQGRGDFTIGAEDEVLVAGDLPPAALLICYEAIFPARAARADRPGWLLNLTNDGWFGELTGPDQHFDMTRFRAVEQGLPLIRAAGTGISGIIDAYGRIQGVIPLGTKGVLDGILPPPASETLFGRTGSIPVLVIAILLLVVSALPRRGN